MMSGRQFLRAVFWLDLGSAEAIALDQFSKPIVFLALIFAGLFFFFSSEPLKHLARYLVSIVFFVFFFRALVLSLIDTKILAASVNDSQRGEMFFAVVTICGFIGSAFFGLAYHDLDYLALASVCLAASAASLKVGKYARTRGAFGILAFLSGVALAVAKPGAATYIGVVLTALACVLLAQRYATSVEP